MPNLGEDYSEAAATFGDRLAAARDGAGLSQKVLAQKLGVSPQALSRWEQDRAEPRANRIQMLAGILNVSIIWLMTGQVTDDQPAPSGDAPDGRVVLAELRDLRETQARLADQLEQLEKRLRKAFA